MEDMEQLVDQYDTWLLDCDGVIWLGEEAVPGVPDTLAELRRRGKRIFFVSNNASKHRATYLTKFRKMGIEASIEDVVTSAVGAAQYCVQRYASFCGNGRAIFTRCRSSFGCGRERGFRQGCVAAHCSPRRVMSGMAREPRCTCAARQASSKSSQT